MEEVGEAHVEVGHGLLRVARQGDAVFVVGGIIINIVVIGIVVVAGCGFVRYVCICKSPPTPLFLHISPSKRQQSINKKHAQGDVGAVIEVDDAALLVHDRDRRDVPVCVCFFKRKFEVLVVGLRWFGWLGGWLGGCDWSADRQIYIHI